MLKRGKWPLWTSGRTASSAVIRSADRMITVVPRMPEPMEISSSAVTLSSTNRGSGCGSPSGDTAPVRYPVTVSTSSSDAMVRRDWPSSCRKVRQETCAGPATSAIANRSWSSRNRMLRTTCSGRCPRSAAACSSELTGPACVKSRYGIPRRSSASATGDDCMPPVYRRGPSRPMPAPSPAASNCQTPGTHTGAAAARYWHAGHSAAPAPGAHP